MGRATEAESALSEWKGRGDSLAAERDPLVRSAYEAGVNINRIHKLSGVSRTTIYKILGLTTESRTWPGAAPTEGLSSRGGDARRR